MFYFFKTDPVGEVTAFHTFARVGSKGGSVAHGKGSGKADGVQLSPELE